MRAPTSPGPFAAAAIRPAAGPRDMETVRALFVEYAKSLNFDLCFQGFDRELSELPGAYAPPKGRILLAESEGRVLGVIALRPLDARVCEMKRLYVRPEARGQRLGERLARAIIADAATLGYTTMRLDTHETMIAAIDLYRALGFREIGEYGKTMVGLRYFERSLEH
jgi:ribosomal protein S18 acetylase RimI-like enzyme